MTIKEKIYIRKTRIKKLSDCVRDCRDKRQQIEQFEKRVTAFIKPDGVDMLVSCIKVDGYHIGYCRYFRDKMPCNQYNCPCYNDNNLRVYQRWLLNQKMKQTKAAFYHIFERIK